MNEFEVTSPSGAFVAQPFPNRSLVDLKWNDVSTVELTFDDDDRALSDFTPDCRLRVHRDGEVLVTGRFAGRSGVGPSGSTVVRFEDDFTDVRNLGWQNPTSPITGQTSEFARYTGPTETVVKSVAAMMSARLGLGWTIPGSTGLGSPQQVEFRMSPLFDKLVDLVKADKLSWWVRDGVMNVTEGALFPGVLTPDSGVIESFQWSESAPKATRLVVGGSGSGTDRDFGVVVDTAREAEWGRVVEVLYSASLTDGGSLAAAGAEALREMGSAVSVAVELVEAAWFKYGQYRLGDRVRLKLGGLDTTDVISRVVFEDGPEMDEVVKPHIGTLETTREAQLQAAVRTLARGWREVRGR